MDWTNESILRFLRLYKSHPCLWDTKQTKLHRNRERVNEAWLEVQKNMHIPCTVPQLKKKKESLMSAYRAYKTKIKNSTAIVGGPVYKPSWFAFATMDSFLSTVYLCNSASTCNRYQSENEPSTDNADSHTEEDQEECQNKRKRTNLDNEDTYEEIDDECEILSRLWARKLRKLPEERRDNLIYKINNLVYRECVENHRQSPVMSPVQIFKEETMSECFSGNASPKELECESNGFNINIVTKTEPDDT